MSGFTKFGWRRLVAKLVNLLKERCVLNVTVDVESNDVVQGFSLKNV
jgi:hypothetical protein